VKVTGVNFFFETQYIYNNRSQAYETICQYYEFYRTVWH